MNMTVERGSGTITAAIRPGEKLIEALERAGVSVSAPCGGRCFCGKCRVKVFGDTSRVLDAERKFLTEQELRDGWRLACACEAKGDLRIVVEESAASVLVEGTAAEYRLNPPVKLVRVTCEKPSLQKQVSDEKRLLAALGGVCRSFSNRALERLPEALRASDETWALTFEDRVLDVSDQPLRALGCAVDIGTTTMASYLVDLTTGEQLATASMLNPQRTHGGDVISRANHTMERADGLAELAKLVREGVNDLIRRMCRQVGASEADVRHVTLAGNTIMMHLAAGLCVKYIATLPFVPVYSGLRHVSGAELNLCCPDAAVTLGPCVAGYVGADTVTASLACALDQPGEVTLLMDIGTNGEMVLRTGDGRLFCCSAAAGPAFEGAHIRCGSGAVEGAIDKVEIEDGQAKVTTVGGKKPVSVCGSGIVSAVAAMLKEELIDETGYLEEDFELAEGVFICQKDIREVQLAKSAIAAGVEILADTAGIEIGDIRKVYLAGGFGSYIDKQAACEIGLIPMELIGRIESVGNAAGQGAKLLLLDGDMLRRAGELAERMTYIELSARADFQERFAENMFFEVE